MHTTTSSICNIQSLIFNQKVFPNPAKQYFTVEYKLPVEIVTNACIEIISIDGKLIKQIPLKHPQYQIIVDTHELSKGMYLCTLKNNGLVVESAIVSILIN